MRRAASEPDAASRRPRDDPRRARGAGERAPAYLIAPARADDIGRIPAIELAAAKLLEPYAPASVLAEVSGTAELEEARREGRLLVALADDVAVGFAHIRLIEPGCAHLEEIDVHPDHGRRGLGTSLVRAACRWADAQGCTALTLTTFRDVPWNMPFYARLGFEVVPATALSPALREVVRAEARKGLDPARRVVMRFRIGEA